jgi:threonine/homoserine/homoserine lactone efflux protein
MLESIFQFLLASVLLTISPGPDILYVLVTGLSRGVKHGILLTLGLVSGVLVHTTLIALGLSVIIKTSETLFFGIKLAGALYLLYLAFKVFKQPARLKVEKSAVAQSKHNYIAQGFLMNVLNPKVTLFFMAFLSQFLWDKSNDTMMQFYILGLIFMVQAFIIFSLVAIFADRFYKIIKNNPKSGIFFKYLQISVFTIIAVFILVSHEY